MVNNKLKILDEGKLKCCPEVKMAKAIHLYYAVLKKKDRLKTISTWSDELCDFKKEVVDNDDYKEPTPRIKYALKKYKDYIFEWDYYAWPKGPQKIDKMFVEWAGGESNIYEYLDIIPFTPSAMINISPDWKSVDWKDRLDKRSNANKTKILKKIIDDYLKENWFDKWSYVIENGSEGDHIHAHFVGHMNVSRLKACESHLAKGNHTQQLKKYANKIKGMKGLIKGVSIQKCILRNETLVKDKLDYLIEEKKPVGHKNKSIIPDGFVTGSL